MGLCCKVKHMLEVLKIARDYAMSRFSTSPAYFTHGTSPIQSQLRTHTETQFAGITIAMSRDESPVVRAVSEEGGYTWAHRAFLQAFLTHSVLTVEEIKPVLANILTAHSKKIAHPFSSAQPANMTT